MTKEFLKKHPDTNPAAPMPFVKTNIAGLPVDKDVFIWFGHSSYFIRANGKTILVDPVFSGSAAPFSFMVKAFPGANAFSVDDMPVIDFLVITHDHYDHLDYTTIRKLKDKVTHIYCSLGVGIHLMYWGIEKEKITELDWWQEATLDAGMKLIAAPARHFSGRGLKRAQSFWSSFVLITPQLRLYLGGDSGYDSHFKEIGKKFGPFDLAILEAGQYNVMWPLIHMMPEETVQAAIELQAKVLIPVHWGKFKLGMHPWNEPVTRVMAKASELGQIVATPRIGEPVQLPADRFQSEQWWK
jgi:L-ascorbate metabolism protein UlaG (beta-lactamase superfamily)